MTKEEKELTITYLTEMQEEYIEGEGYERHPLPEYYALDTAIKVLNQPTSDDCVSRKAVFETIDDCNSDGLKGSFCSYDDGERFKEYVKMLPPVTPTFPKGVTNGDMIKAMFPKAWGSNYIDISNKFTLYMDNDHELEVDMDWWNAPYKEESK